MPTVPHYQLQAVDEALIDQIVDLVADRIGEEDSREAALVLADPAFDRGRWSVVTNGAQVVSTAAAFPMTLKYGSVALAATNLEFVATAMDHEGRGLVRRQLEYHHQMAAAHDELVQIIVGIPYFYRLFGYEYALPVQPLRVLPADMAVAMPDDWSLRQARLADVELIGGLQEAATKDVPVVFSHLPATWRYLVESPVYRTVIAEAPSGERAMGRIYLDDDTPILFEVSAASVDGLAALTIEARSLAPGQQVFLLSRPTIESLLAAWHTDDYRYGYYIRIAEPTQFLNAVRPVLQERLDGGGGSFDGSHLISLYRSSIEFDIDDDQLSQFRSGPAEPAPGSKGGAGVPPDLLATLVFGSVGVDVLANRHPDFRPGKLRSLLQILFPAGEADVASWVVP